MTGFTRDYLLLISYVLLASTKLHDKSYLFTSIFNSSVIAHEQCSPCVT